MTTDPSGIITDANKQMEVLGLRARRTDRRAVQELLHRSATGLLIFTKKIVGLLARYGFRPVPGECLYGAEADAEVAKWGREIVNKSPTALAIAERTFNASTESIRGIGTTMPTIRARACARSSKSKTRRQQGLKGLNMSIKVRPLSHALGAEITGVDLREPLGTAAEQEVRRAWLEHHVIVFPGQQLTPAQQIAFGRMFGELDDHKALPFYQHPEHSEIYLITNKQIGGKPSETRDTGREWHSDHSFTTRPTMATMLYCREIPAVGGTTMFTNMNLAYETLSPALRALLDPLEAVHSFAHYSARALRHRDPRQIAHMTEINPPVAQPVVRVHPETGRKALYLSEMMTSHFVGMTPQESEGLLQYLFTHSVRPEFTYRHAWSVNDLLMWDNRCTQHLALGDYTHDQPRHMHRITVLGTPCGRSVEASA